VTRCREGDQQAKREQGRAHVLNHRSLPYFAHYIPAGPASTRIIENWNTVQHVNQATNAIPTPPPGALCWRSIDGYLRAAAKLKHDLAEQQPLREVS
jgi:hypothetical protein